MFCSNCGKNIADRTVCPYCGFQMISPQVPTVPAQEAPAYGEAAPAYPNAGYPEADGQPVPYPAAPVPETTYPDGYADAAQQPYPADPNAAGYNAAYEQNPAYPYPPAPQAPLKPKKKKKGLIIGIISGAAVLLAGAAVAVYFLVLAPLFSYNKAVSLKEDGKYQEAIEAFTDLKDYKDSPDQITECRYLAAKQLAATGKYDEAVAAFEALGDYSDSKDQIKQCGYDKAKKLFDDGEYDKAKEAFLALGDYADSADQATACDYAVAKALIESDPEEAVELLEALGDYQDSGELVKQAKMTYCEQNRDNTDETTYAYLKDLKSAGYAGASALYDELYTYRITEVFWNDDPDNTDPASNATKLSSAELQVLHFSLEGGTPDDTDMQIHYTVTWPGGNKNEGHYSKRFNNYTLKLTNDAKGTIKVEIYSQDNTKLYTTTVTVI